MADLERSTLHATEPLTLLTPAGTAVSAASEHIPPGTYIGPYRILGPLGEGGMGRVFEAEQLEPIRRRVALKLMQSQLQGGLAEAYFEVERQALASMEHPAIAKVYDAGRTADGFPYFAMERVDGRPLDQWCRAHGPSLETRLRLAIALARGIHHAHQRGIVHRDIKPRNVLVTEIDGEPQPRIIDFGIALGLAGANATSEATGSAAGTVHYMSPEQARGELAAIDIRSDVYSLGMVLLCMLLPEARLARLGDRVPDPATLQAWLASPEAAGQAAPVLRAIPSELRHLLRRALAPEREARYASAEDLALEIERFLRHEPLAAVPASRRYRAGRFLRRHRLGLTAAAAVVLALSVGLLLALLAMQRAQHQAERSLALAEFMGEVLSGADPDRARDLDRALLELILEQAAERAASQLARHPDARAEIQGVIASTYASLGEYARARRHAQEAHRMSLETLGPGHRQTLRQARILADVLGNDGNPQDAEVIARQALDRLHGGMRRDPELFAQLALSLGWAQREQARFDAALENFRAARLALAEVRRGDDPDPHSARYYEAIALTDLGRFQEAEAQLEGLIEARTRVDGPDHPRTLRVKNSLAVFLLQQGRYAEAAEVLLEAVPAHERAFGAEHFLTLSAMANLAGALRQSGQLEASGPYYRRAFEGLSNRLGERHPRAIIARHNLGNYLREAGEPDAALAHQETALAFADEVLGREHAVTSEIIGALGRLALDRGDLDTAARLLDEALEIKRRVHGERHRTIDRLLELRQELEDARSATP
jgi:Tfp pilus assembly protein PilF